MDVVLLNNNNNRRPTPPNLFPLQVQKGTEIYGDTTEFTQNNSVTLSSTTEQAYLGTRSLKFICGNAGASEGFSTLSYTCLPSITHTVFFIVKGNAGATVKAVIKERNSGDGAIGLTESGVYTLTGGWDVLTVSRAFGSTGVKLRGLVYTASQQSLTGYADEMYAF